MSSLNILFGGFILLIPVFSILGIVWIWLIWRTFDLLLGIHEEYYILIPFFILVLLPALIGLAMIIAGLKPL